MPFTPYPIDGTVYSLDGTTAAAGATVKAVNSATGESVSVSTNSSGQFILDLANLKASIGTTQSGYSDRDVIIITATDGTSTGYWRHTVNVNEGQSSFNLYLINNTTTIGNVDWSTFMMKSITLSASVKTTATVLIPPINIERASNFSVTTHNRSAQNLTVSLWVSNLDNPGTPGGDTWALIESAITVNAGTRDATEEVLKRYRWFCVTVTAAAAVSKTVDVAFMATT